MTPKTTDIINCYVSGKPQEFSKYTKMLGARPGVEQAELEKYWDKVRPDGTYNNYILDEHIPR